MSVVQNIYKNCEMSNDMSRVDQRAKAEDRVIVP